MPQSIVYTFSFRGFFGEQGEFIVLFDRQKVRRYQMTVIKAAAATDEEVALQWLQLSCVNDDLKCIECVVFFFVGFI